MEFEKWSLYSGSILFEFGESERQHKFFDIYLL